MSFSSTPIKTDVAAWLPVTKQLIKRFTYEDRFGESIEHFVTDLVTDQIGCPRAVFPQLGTDERVVGEKIEFPPVPLVPRDGQEEFIGLASELLLEGNNFVAQAPTGWGKTVAATQLIRAVGRTTLIIVTKEDLLEQWEAEIGKWLGVKTGLIRGNTWDIQPITIAMVHTLAQRGVPEDVAKYFGFVIWDECHRMAAETFSRTAFQFPAKLRLGLSATPQRIDGREQMIFDTIGPIMVVHEGLQLVPSVALYKSRWQCPRWRCKACKGAGCPACDGDGYTKARADIGKTMHLEKDIAQHPERNGMLLKIIHQAYEKNRRIVVFSSLVAHLKFLKESLEKHLGVPSDDTALYISGLSKKGRAQAAARKVIFATWGMMGEGTDIPWLDVCVLATPRANVEQAIGRVLREYPNKPDPVVVDVVDYDHHVFEKYASKRRKLYTKMGSETRHYKS